MCSPQLGIASLGIQTAGGIFSAIQQGNAGASQENYYQNLAALNESKANVIDQQAQIYSNQVQDQAAVQASQVRDKSQATQSAQIAQMAANGVDVSGSTVAEQSISDTVNKAQQDEMAIRYNADLSAYNATQNAAWQSLDLRNQASDYRIAGRNKGIEAGVNQFNTLLGTASSVGMQAYQMNREGVFNNLFGDSSPSGGGSVSKQFAGGPNLLPSELQTPIEPSLLDKSGTFKATALNPGNLASQFTEYNQRNPYTQDGPISLSLPSGMRKGPPTLLKGKKF